MGSLKLRPNKRLRNIYIRVYSLDTIHSYIINRDILNVSVKFSSAVGEGRYAT